MRPSNTQPPQKLTEAPFDLHGAASSLSEVVSLARRSASPAHEIQVLDKIHRAELCEESVLVRSQQVAWTTDS